MAAVPREAAASIDKRQPDLACPPYRKSRIANAILVIVSQENVDLVRTAYATSYGGEDWCAWVDEFLAADCEIEDRTLPDVAVGLRGPAAARAEAAHMLDAFEDVDYAVEEMRDLDDRVLARVRASGRGRGSGLRIDGTLGHLWTLHAGKVVRFDVYGTWQEALDAVGHTA